MTTGIVRALHALHIYGTAGIVALGWTLGQLLGFRCGTYMPLWLAGALFVYNIDRLKRDPADAINTPRRLEETARLRKLSVAIAAVAGVALLAIPIFTRDWLMLALAVAGGFVCLSYSIPFVSFRLKDVPFLKTFFAPTLLAAACLVPPLLQQGLSVRPAHYAAASAWTWCILLFNMILCDLRDIDGDRASGTLSIPVFLGPVATQRWLVLLLAVIAGLSCAAVATAPDASSGVWKWIAALSPIYLAGLLVALRRPRPEDFYEWWVEGILFVPAAVWLLAHAAVMP